MNLENTKERSEHTFSCPNDIARMRGRAPPPILSHHSEPKVPLFTLATDSAITPSLLILLFFLGYASRGDLKNLELEMQMLFPFWKPNWELRKPTLQIPENTVRIPLYCDGLPMHRMRHWHGIL